LAVPCLKNDTVGMHAQRNHFHTKIFVFHRATLNMLLFMILRYILQPGQIHPLVDSEPHHRYGYFSIDTGAHKVGAEIPLKRGIQYIPAIFFLRKHTESYLEVSEAPRSQKELGGAR
jgi:hypothetical protein